jgi:hypothetical protein
MVRKKSNRVHVSFVIPLGFEPKKITYIFPRILLDLCLAFRIDCVNSECSVLMDKLSS